MLASLNTDGWQLESGVEAHGAAPATFAIPGEAIRSRLVPESHAKLIFTLRTPDGSHTVERMWVRITGYTEDAYEGELANDPETEDAPLKFGERVEFHPDHVIDAQPPENWNPETKQYE